jgi:hypothetical protein
MNASTAAQTAKVSRIESLLTIRLPAARRA